MPESTFQLKQLSDLIGSLPDALLVVDHQGNILLLNHLIEIIFGYTHEELIGKKVEYLIPERFKAHHPLYRDKFYQNPRTRPMGIGMELFGLKKDGSEFPVEISLSPMQTEVGNIVLAAVRDISLRKKTENILNINLSKAHKNDKKNNVR